jgi:Ca2+-binding RTX toxin-like protein
MALVNGTAGNDLINAAFLPQGTTPGDDQIFAFDGNDIIEASGGNDTIDGGNGYDIARYLGAGRYVWHLGSRQLRELDAATGLVIKTDLLNSIEEVQAANALSLTVIGTFNQETVVSALGTRLTFIGGGGEAANAGADTVQYVAPLPGSGIPLTGVYVDLQRGLARKPDGTRDTLRDVEIVIGTSLNDVLVGSIDFQFLRGGAGDDTLISNADVPASFWATGVDYSTAASGVTVDLHAGTAQDGEGGTDTIIGRFFTVRGSAHADLLVGDDFLNAFTPGNGPDVIDGRGGFDRVQYPDEVNADPDGDGFVVTAVLNADGSGTARTADGTLDVFTNIEFLRGSSFRDSLSAAGLGGVTFGAWTIPISFEPPSSGIEGYQQLEGGPGNDLLTGAPGGFVMLRYTALNQAIFADLGAGFATDAAGGTDTLVNIWGVRGGDLADVLILGDQGGYARGRGGDDLIIGGAGIDMAGYIGVTRAIEVDLAAGTAIDGLGGIDQLVSIEVIYGGFGNDIIRGDDNDNWFIGNLGNDLLDGRGGSDTAVYFYNSASEGAVTVDLAAGTAEDGGGLDTLISIENVIGTAFADQLSGTSGDNALYGWLGDDLLEGGAGNDLLDGGDGEDTANYLSAPSRVVVNLALAGPQNTQGAGLDTLVSIENLLGSAFNDTLTGNAAANTLLGYDGNDTIFGLDGNDEIDGGAGNDILQGNGGIDTVAYDSANGPVVVSLALQGAWQNTIGAGNDYLNGFENLRGSFFSDTLTGNAAANVIEGGSGNDTIDGGAGNDTIDGGDGNDTLIGGAGTDTASYASAFFGVTVSLALQGVAQNTISAGIDTLSGFENLTGSAFDDVLTGDAGANTLRGGAGDDILEGGLGNDLLYGGDGIDLASYANAAGPVTVTLNAFSGTVAAGTDYFYDIEGFIGSAFNDTLTGNAFDNLLIGGDGDDRLYGLAGNDRFVGGAGNDQYYGGDGIDTVDYSSATLAVRAILGGAGFVNTINYGSDLFNGIENLIGGSANDILTGDGNANRLEGGGGNDTINGGAGDDVILGGDGNDIITGGLGADAIDLGTGFDRVYFQTAADSRAASMDRITNFTQNGGDGQDRLYFENNPNALFAGVAPTAIVLAPRIFIEAASTGEDAVAQIGSFAASTASTLSVVQVDIALGQVAGRYLLVNDTNPTFDDAADMVIEIVMAPGSTTNLTAANFFLF